MEDKIMSALAAKTFNEKDTIKERQFKVCFLEFQAHKEEFTKLNVTYQHLKTKVQDIYGDKDGRPKYKKDGSDNENQSIIATM